MYNIGKTKTPKGFPTHTPTFKLTFEKGFLTRGYYSKTEKIYTVIQAIVHFTY